MPLFAERNRLIGTENAFKIGPHIVNVESMGTPVIKLNLGEPDSSAETPAARNASSDALPQTPQLDVE